MFEEMLQKAESGSETYCQSYKAGYTAIWYEADGVEYQVQYDTFTGKAQSVQEVGTLDVTMNEQENVTSRSRGGQSPAKPH